MQHLTQILDSLKKQDNYRVLRDFRHSGAYLLQGQKKLLNFASNDYLGIANNKKIYHKFYQWLESKECKNFRKPLLFSSSSSRLLSGGFCVFEAFEEYLDSMFYPKKSLLFNSGYHLNISLLQALGSLPRSLFLLDYFMHATVIDGVRLSGADFKRFRHNDILHLRELLESRASNYEHIFIVSEGVFSMEGDLAFLSEIIAIKNEYKKLGKNIYIYLDEAHSVGVFGKGLDVHKSTNSTNKLPKNFLSDFEVKNDGLGLARALGLQWQVDFLVFTFGKAIGSVGACVICDKKYREFFVNKARGLIYSTALPPINVAFSYFVFLQLCNGTKTITTQRKNLTKLSAFFSYKLAKIACKYHLNLRGNTQILSLILGQNIKALNLAKKLESSGIYAPAIKHPTVPDNTARIRFSLNANISLQEAQHTLEILEKHIKSILK